MIPRRSGKAIELHRDTTPQLELFSTFFGNDKDLSNTIELWDAIPKYAISARKQAILRDEHGRLPIHEYEFIYRRSRKGNFPVKASLKLTPARVSVDGKEIDFYPSSDEEIIEDVLRKMLSDQRYGLHDVHDLQSWVRFKGYTIRQELKRRNRSRSWDEVKRSFEIMSGCKLQVFLHIDGTRKRVYDAAILSDTVSVERDSYLSDPKAEWAVRLPMLVSTAMNLAAYRQYNYALSMDLRMPLSRWMLKQMSHCYINAHLLTPYRILYSSIKRDSAMLLHSRDYRNRDTVRDMWTELQDKNVILNITEEECESEATAEDIRFTATPSSDFVSEVKAANARQRDAIETLEITDKTDMW